MPVSPTPQVQIPSSTEVSPTATVSSLTESTTRTPQDDPSTLASPAATSGAVQTVFPTVATSAEENKQVQDVEAAASEVRGLTPKEDVPEEFITRDQLRSNLINDMKKDYSPQEAKDDALELWLLRLVDNRSIDLYQLYIDLYTENIAGYYDPKENKLFVLGDQQQLSPQSRETLAHEFVHGLQDQHYDLEKLLPDNSPDDDRSTAIRSLVEGDATLSGVMYAYKHLTKEEFQQLIDESRNNPSDVIDKAPAYIKDSLLFPYTTGADFVSKLIEQGGFDRVNKALADPPVSTEQIMHPDKYLEPLRDLPLPVTVPPLTSTLGTGWTFVEGSTLGEFDLLEILKANGTSSPDNVAEGWGGARYALYRNGNDGLVIVDSRWDSASEAKEFEDGLRETFQKVSTVGDIWKDSAGRFFGIKRIGDRLALVASTTDTSVQKALGEVK
ncbi:MAG TPA: hypothetical protein VM409_06415 [Chloroflexia bacterium]|nr:hypothetical protein [Chloroflexia bacterium]